MYDYVFDRLRAVRQDAVMQGLDGDIIITLMENIVRFHIYAEYRYVDLGFLVIFLPQCLRILPSAEIIGHW